MTSPLHSAAARAGVAPGGVLRVALNHANFLLVSSPAPDAVGVAPDLGRELGRRLHLPVAFIGYEHAGHVADAAGGDAWDVAFIGADPARAGDMDFSAPYLGIEATFLVPAASAINKVEEVDRPGVRIAVASRSAYDLYLQRVIRDAILVPAAGLDQSAELFLRAGLDVLAGLRPHLLQVQATIPGSRVLAGRFMTVQQAMGVPRGRPEAARVVRAFVEEVLATGFVEALVRRHGVEGVTGATACGPWAGPAE